MTHLKPSEIHNPEGVVFHRYGLSNIDGRTENGFDVKTFGTLRHLLNHTEVVYRYIDIFIWVNTIYYALIQNNDKAYMK